MKRGASLVEVILAISLIGLIILFLFGLLPSTALLTRQAEQQVGATRYAEQILAHLGSVSFADLKSANGVTLTPSVPGRLAGLLEDRVLDDKTVLHPSVTFQTLPPNERLVQVTVLVEWSAGRRQKAYRSVRSFSSVLR